MDLDLKGKCALITGGSKGIGRAIARALAEEGAMVAIAARNRADLDKAASSIAKETGATILPIQADTSSNESVAAMVKTVVEKLGGLDILVNCAARPGGQSPPPKLEEITDEEFISEMNVKVLGYLRCAREAAPHMRSKGWGRIINISGLAARHTGSILGSIRNVGVAALTKNLADELGPHGINVTVVHPGRTRTEKTAEAHTRQAAKLAIPLEQYEKRMAGSTCIGKLPDARDIAHVVAFLASPKSIAISGDAIAAGGGEIHAIHY